MFIPFGVEHSFSRVPFVTFALLATIVLVAILSGLPGEGSGPYAVDPSDFHLYQLVTSAFLHGGFVHLLGNLLFLWVFGRYVEDRLGPARFAAVYFAATVFSGLAQLAFGGDRPSIGASGGVAGLMGYVLVAAPWLEVHCALMFGTYVSKGFDLAAGWLLVPWLLFQLVEASLGSFSDIAAWAHIGGFLFGAGAAAIMRSRRCKGTGWYIDPSPPQGGKAAVERLRRARG